MAKEQQKEKKSPVKKKAPVVKAPENLILKGAIHIPGFSKYNDGKMHAVKGGHYPEGTIVTEDMVEAYEEARINLGGNTPITAFCY